MSDKMVVKIQALLAKAERGATQEESEAFFAKAQELMTKWAIDDAMLNSTRADKNREVVGTENVKVPSSYFKPDVSLFNHVAKANNCKLLMDQYKFYIVLIGFPSDRERAKMLFTSLHLQVSRLARRLNLDHLYTQKERTLYRRSYRYGFANAVGQRLIKVSEDSVASSDANTLPVLRNRKDEVEDFYDRMGKGKVRARRSRILRDAVQHGYVAGQTADIGHGRLSGNRRAIR